MEILQATEKDYNDIIYVTRESFWNVYQPGADDHYLFHILTTHKDFIKELCLISVINNKIIGNITYSIASIIGGDNIRYQILTFRPISILPSMQGGGKGKKLIFESISKARKMGYKGIVIYGNPLYYKKFGFKNCHEYEISDHNGRYSKSLLVLELYDGALGNIKGKFIESDAFNIDPEECEKFDNKYPKKEKYISHGQIALKNLIDLNYNNEYANDIHLLGSSKRI